MAEPTGPARDQAALRTSGRVLAKSVTLLRDGTPIERGFDRLVAGRRVVVVALSDLGGLPVAKAPAWRLYDEVARSAPGWAGPSAAALKRRVLLLTGAGAAAVLVPRPDGREACIAFVGRPFDRPGELVLRWGGGDLVGFRRVEAHYDELALQRFAAYHEIGGHCADPAFSASTNASTYARARAELRADVLATLAMTQEEGSDRTARCVAALRRAASVLGAIASNPARGFDDAVLYDTAPGIEAAAAWMTAHRARHDGSSRIGPRELLRAADAITARVMPARPAFAAFTHRFIELMVAVRDSGRDPREALGAYVTPEDRAWFSTGAAAVKAVFGAALAPPGAVAPVSASLARQMR